MSVQALALHLPNQARDLADTAARAAARGAAPRTRAFHAGQQAHAAAAAGDRHAALRHLATAETMLEKATSPSPSLGGYHPAALLYHTSHVRHLLGDTARAITAMTTSLRLRPNAEQRATALTEAQLAEMHLDQCHLDQACATWNTFLAHAQRTNSGRVTTKIITMRQRLRPHSRHLAARRLLDATQTGMRR